MSIEISRRDREEVERFERDLQVKILEALQNSSRRIKPLDGEPDPDSALGRLLAIGREGAKK